MSVWIQIRMDFLAVLIWVQHVCEGYQQTKKLLLARRELRDSFLGGNQNKALRIKYIVQGNNTFGHSEHFKKQITSYSQCMVTMCILNPYFILINSPGKPSVAWRRTKICDYSIIQMYRHSVFN